MAAAAVPEVVRELAGRLADAFETDRGLAEQQNDCQDRLRAGNGQLWSGLHPDALGLLYDDTAAVGVYEGGSVITGRMIDALGAGLPSAEVEAAVLPGLQEAHWAIHRVRHRHSRRLRGSAAHARHDDLSGLLEREAARSGVDSICSPHREKRDRA